jgi:hypothetical protein
MVRIDVPAPAVTLAGLKEVAGPEGEIVAVRDTSLANPLEATMVMVEEPVLPSLTITESG